MNTNREVRPKLRDLEVQVRKLIWQLQDARDVENDPEIARKLNQAAAQLWVADDILVDLNLPPRAEREAL